MKKITLFLLSFLIAAPFTANAASNTQDLVLKKVTNDVWSIVGPLTNRTKENLGNNATFGFVVTDEDVILVDPGGSF